MGLLQRYRGVSGFLGFCLFSKRGLSSVHRGSTWVLQEFWGGFRAWGFKVLFKV